jgi:intein-encoded DNA endonuclease-like protein
MLRRVVTYFIYNTDTKLLTYVRELMKILGIETTGPRINTRQVAVFYSAQRGKHYAASKDFYQLCIPASSGLDFYRKVGFTIKQKRERLENYLKRRHNPPRIFPHTIIHI